MRSRLQFIKDSVFIIVCLVQEDTCFASVLVITAVTK